LDKEKCFGEDVLEKLQETVKKLTVPFVQDTEFEETVEELFEEEEWFVSIIQSLPSSAVLLFDSRTGNMIFHDKIVLSDKELERRKNAKTIFGGFRFPEKETVFAFHDVDHLDTDEIAAFEELFDWEIELFQSFLPNDRNEEEQDFHDIWIQEWKQFYFTLLGQEHVDLAAALSSDRIFLAAATVSDTNPLKNSFHDVIEYFQKQSGENENIQKFTDAVKTYWKENLSTVEGFNISSLSIPLSELSDDIPLPLQNQTMTVYWAVKKNQAVALAAGFNKEKTEQVFRNALAATKTPVASQPEFVFSLKPLGKLLSSFDVETAALGNADSGAKFTLSTTFEENTGSESLVITGRFIETIASLIKELTE
ncbi:MAG: hypothetical protein LBQ50_14835, partial [Planctomycetaceae bacterium]|jgi:hypothetical protein|nr:hypothetical protein [Planctomycetaceae bacterium]